MDENQREYKLVVFHQFKQYLPNDVAYVSVCNEARCILGFCGIKQKASLLMSVCSGEPKLSGSIENVISSINTRL